MLVFEYRNLEPANSLAITNLHLREFPQFFLSKLGSSFLELFYKSVLESPSGFGVGVFHEEQLVGFAIGNTNDAHFFSSIVKRNITSYSIAFMKIFFKNPLLIVLLASKFFSKSKSIRYNIPCLMSVARDRKINYPLGKVLIEQFELLLKEKKIDLYFLTTDKFNNDKVNFFYERNGFFLKDSFSQNGRIMNIYFKNIKHD